MGAFALVRKTLGPDVIDHISSVFDKRGFPAPKKLETRDHVLLLCNKIVSPMPNLFIDEMGDFAAATGTMFYRDSFGLQGLAHLLADAKAERIDETAFFGSFAVIIKTGLKLVMFGDALGSYKIYKNDDISVVSSSFLACLPTIDYPQFETQSVYEYVFNGACFGNATLLKGLSLLGPEDHIRLEPSLLQEQRDITPDLSVSQASLGEHVEANLSVLRRQYAAIYRAFGDQVDTALSGGYDSRLTLALLRAQGANPHIHVYGATHDPDVIVAQRIAAGEGFRLVHADKNALGDPSPEGVAAAVETQFWAFDGAPTDGIVGSGSDLATRRARTEGGILALNGGGGEIFRNFFYLPPRAFTILELVWTFYNQFDPKVAREPFSETDYNRALERKIAAIFQDPRRELTRVQIEYVYPGFRGRFWTGLNTSLNNAFGPALTPFFDMSVVREAIRVPMRFKNHGILEAAMIAAVDPRLAQYPSAYGHDFLGTPPLSKRLADWGTYLRPPLLRRLSYRMKSSIQGFDLSRDFKPEYRQGYLPSGTPVMDQYFDLSAMRDNEQINRLLTLEVLAQKMNIT